MSDFTYTVFLIVASLAGFLVGLLAAGVILVLISDTRRPRQTPDAVELPRAA